MRFAALLAFLAVVLCSSCQSTINYHVNPEGLSKPVVASADGYEVVSMIRSVGNVSAFDILGLMRSPAQSLEAAETLATKSGLMAEAVAVGADAIMDIEVVSMQSFPGCSVFSGYLPIAGGTVVVTAKALKRSGAPAVAAPPATP